MFVTGPSGPVCVGSETIVRRRMQGTDGRIIVTDDHIFFREGSFRVRYLKGRTGFDEIYHVPRDF